MRALTIIASSVLLGGCLNTTAPDRETVSGWQMPIEIRPISSTGGETIIESFVPGTGIVRANAKAMEAIGQELPKDPGPNRTIDACIAAVIGEASKVGAKTIEAASAGPERQAKGGNYFAPVRFRITYVRPYGYDVRDDAMICVTKPDGSIVDAYMAER
jgi:hypothetical protein